MYVLLYCLSDVYGSSVHPSVCSRDDWVPCPTLSRSRPRIQCLLTMCTPPHQRTTTVRSPWGPSWTTPCTGRHQDIGTYTTTGKWPARWGTTRSTHASQLMRRPCNHNHRLILFSLGSTTVSARTHTHTHTYTHTHTHLTIAIAQTCIMATKC